MPPRACARPADRSSSAATCSSGPIAAPARTPRQLRRAQPARQLQQRQRVAVRLGQDPIPDLIIEPEPVHRAQQRAGVRLLQASYLQLRQPPELLAGLACSEDQPDRLGQQPPRCER
jgi:hypothetical protein